MNDCIFCKIVNGELPSSKVYEDGDFIAILDIKPTNFGHTLVIPKEHHLNLIQTPKEILGEMLKIVPDIANAIMKATDSPAFNIVVNNGRDAGQIVDHLHLHIVPRKADDGFKHWPGKDYESPEAMNQLADKIRSLQ